ncbi:hypothetical protein Cyast_0045 [Cyanobacterium stanieri PCC 7202]|uniref:Uncharacterized protein n=1 Tax=Cyanobacterium stanieri (strain ATCC 29140 / PCC 7202) TaxID=292563 RepID=K9YGP2_CYASC|nr:hypothetical protein Cyast_0045 [Cyanobacterium stanieri PCC 7202]
MLRLNVDAIAPTHKLDRTVRSKLFRALIIP